MVDAQLPSGEVSDDVRSFCDVFSLPLSEKPLPGQSVKLQVWDLRCIDSVCAVQSRSKHSGLKLVRKCTYAYGYT